jgi:hypothetical protein
MTPRVRRLVNASTLASVVVVALLPVGSAQQSGSTLPARAPGPSTPRTGDGHPDFSGMWGGRGGGGNGPKPDAFGNLKVLTRQRPCSRTQIANGSCEPAVNFERDSGLQQRLSANMPMYKPQFWEQVQRLDRDGTLEDPEFNCKPAGVPRMGPPNKIVQTATELILLYQTGNTFRVVPIDGRPHDPVKSVDTTWYGDAVGRWEGDTLAIDIVGFNDESWLGWAGWFHSNNMHVVERLTRRGDTLTWQATVEDPDVLIQPFVMNARTMRLNANPKAMLTEDLPCEERDRQHMMTKERG